jgi:hypothetical protein
MLKERNGGTSSIKTLTPSVQVQILTGGIYLYQVELHCHITLVSLGGICLKQSLTPWYLFCRGLYKYMN